jgi:hypothetical protein
LPGQLDDIGRFRDVDDAATENIGHTLHLFAILAGSTNLDQHQFALDMRRLGEIDHLDHINQLVELLGDLFEHLVGTPGQDGHPRQRGIFRRRHGQRFDIVAACREQPGNAESAPDSFSIRMEMICRIFVLPRLQIFSRIISVRPLPAATIGKTLATGSMMKSMNTRSSLCSVKACATPARHLPASRSSCQRGHRLPPA